ncbi:MAG: RagB/SusD family nutrient uptake outer membrane protein [Reichenbachiella sp.]
MKTIKNIYFLLLIALLPMGCKDVLDLEPLDKITAQDLFSDENGTALYLADLYNRLPMEDLTYFPRDGFDYNYGNPNNIGFVNEMLTPYADHTEGNRWFASNMLWWWRNPWEDRWNDTDKARARTETPWTLLRNTNLFLEVIPELEVDSVKKARYLGEASFIRAFTYFGLAKRYGGVPIILEAQVLGEDPDELIVPRSTEKETWDFLLAECDIAIANLDDKDPNNRRASKWAALALKSRAALHAASIAKFNDQLDLVGPAVTEGLVGIDPSFANEYYQMAIDASEQIMDESPYSLYAPTPANPEEAVANISGMFEDPNIVGDSEAILIKGRTFGLNTKGDNYQIWYVPNQLRNGWPHPGRMNPTLDIVDLFESYSNPGVSSPIVTTVDGDTENYLGFDGSRTYLKYAHPLEIFADKDARLRAQIMLPGETFKGTEIVYQNGYVRPDGTLFSYGNGSQTVDGTTYYSYGAANSSQYSGFSPEGGNHTWTGFGLKKFLTTGDFVPAWNTGNTDFMEFRYAEILLNYAEAVVESGLGDVAKATEAMNSIRRRAAHTVDIPLTVENVQRERKVELVFENKIIWDLIRRREYHTEFQGYVKKILQPVRDLRVAPYDYIFIRQDSRKTPKTFQHRDYYRPIDNRSLNTLTQNPGW